MQHVYVIPFLIISFPFSLKTTRCQRVNKLVYLYTMKFLSYKTLQTRALVTFSSCNRFWKIFHIPLTTHNVSLPHCMRVNVTNKLLVLVNIITSHHALPLYPRLSHIMDSYRDRPHASEADLFVVCIYIK